MPFDRFVFGGVDYLAKISEDNVELQENLSEACEAVGEYYNP